MATTIKSNTLVPAHGHELVVLEDDFGTKHHLYIAVGDLERRDEIIQAEQAARDEHVAVVRAYAEKTGAALPESANT